MFATLIVSLQLKTHRLYFKTYHNSFTTDEAAENLSALKFSQSNRAPDPREPSRVVTTTTTTTFSMTRDMAKGICQHFMDAKLIENAADPQAPLFKDKGVFQLTPKGLHILERFITKNGINGEHLLTVFSAQPICMRLLHLERRAHDDELLINRPIIEVIFKRFCGRMPNYVSASGGTPGQSGKKALEKQDDQRGIEVSDITDKSQKGTKSSAATTIKHTFPAVNALDWLCDYTTICGRDEAAEICAHFHRMGLIELVKDTSRRDSDEEVVVVQGEDGIGRVSQGEYRCYSKAIYAITDAGRTVARWPGYAPVSNEGTSSARPSHDAASSGASMSGRAANAGGGSDYGSNQGFESHEQEHWADAEAAETEEQQEVLASNGLERSFSDANEQIPGRASPAAQSLTGASRTPSVSSSSESHARNRLFRKPSAAEVFRNDYMVRANSSAGAGRDTPSPIGHYLRDNSANRLRQILEEPRLRREFREFLKQNFCEENLSFWLDVQDFKRRFHTTSSAVAVKSGSEGSATDGKTRRGGLFNRTAAKQSVPSSQGSGFTAMEKHQQDLIAMAFVVYTTYLAPSSPCELNIDHSMRSELVSYMTKVLTEARASAGDEGGGLKTVRADEILEDANNAGGALPPSLAGPRPSGDGQVFGSSVQERRNNVLASMPKAPLHASQLQTMVRLYEKIQDHTFKLMATDSVPRFIKDPRFLRLVENGEVFSDAFESGSSDPHDDVGRAIS